MRRIVPLILALTLVFAACSGDSDPDSVFISEDPGEADVDSTAGDDDPNSGSDSESGSGSESDSESGSGDGSESSVSTANLESAFPLPPGEVTAADWAPFTRTESEFGVNENGTYELRDLSVEEVVSFYESMLAEMGYEVGPRLELGESIALNITDPDDAATTAVVQVGEADGVIIVSQDKFVPAPTGPTTTQPAATAVSGDSDG